MIKNVLLDWSGTISNDLPVVYNTTMRIFDYFKTPKIGLEEYRRASRIPYLQNYKAYIPAITKESLDVLFPGFFGEEKRLLKPSIFPGIKEVLEGLSDAGIKLYVLSSHLKDELIEEAESYGIKELFSNIYSGVRDKSKVITSILRGEGLNPEDTIFFGDMMHDVITGRKGRVYTGAVTWGYHYPDMLESVHPDVIINSVEGILTACKSF